MHTVKKSGAATNPSRKRKGIRKGSSRLTTLEWEDSIPPESAHRGSLVTYRRLNRFTHRGFPEPGTFFHYSGKGCTNDPKLGRHFVVVLGYAVDRTDPSNPIIYSICAVLTSSQNPFYSRTYKSLGPKPGKYRHIPEQAVYHQLKGWFPIGEDLVQCKPYRFTVPTFRADACPKVIPYDCLEPIRGSAHINQHTLNYRSWASFLNNELLQDADSGDFRYMGEFTKGDGHPKSWPRR